MLDGDAQGNGAMDARGVDPVNDDPGMANKIGMPQVTLMTMANGGQMNNGSSGAMRVR